jgi:hypothetical protein
MIGILVTCTFIMIYHSQRFHFVSRTAKLAVRERLAISVLLEHFTLALRYGILTC